MLIFLSLIIYVIVWFIVWYTIFALFQGNKWPVYWSEDSKISFIILFGISIVASMLSIGNMFK